MAGGCLKFVLGIGCAFAVGLLFGLTALVLAPKLLG